MKEKIEQVAQDIRAFVIENPAQLEEFRIAYMGRKGHIADLFDGMKTVPNEEKKLVGQQLNGLKQLAQERFDEAQEKLAGSQTSSEKLNIDFTLWMISPAR